MNPDKPVLMYFVPGAMHAPHHVTAEWRDRFAGQFDRGWDAVREETVQRQREMGIIPPDTENTPRPEWCPASGFARTRREAALRAVHGELGRLYGLHRP